ncbi:MAG: RNase adapter RapZ, partial [Oscillatoria sp. PMC 1076.18]|nr:RNase adapter RapZ [Oscillatoria sp. PMC 1076.18]
IKNSIKMNLLEPDTNQETVSVLPGRVKIMSFGFKYGLPNANYYFDVSFAKNPARQKAWGMFGTIDIDMVEFVLAQKEVSNFIDLIIPVIKHIATVDSYQVVAFGCNAGRHRSPIIASEVAARISETISTIVEHRDLPDYEAFVASLRNGKSSSKT